MCNYTLDWNDVAERTGTSVAQLRQTCHYDEERLREMASDGILVFDDHHITVNTDGRPFVRCGCRPRPVDAAYRQTFF